MIILLQPITLYELLSFAVSIFGFATVIVTLLLMNRQTREMTVQTKSVAASLDDSVYQSSAAMMFTVDEIFIKYPELRPYFYSGKEIEENDTAYNRVLAVSEFLLDFFGSILIQSKHFPAIWPYNWWKPYFTEMFANSPILCQYLEAKKTWYTDDMVLLMEAAQTHRRP